MFKPKGTALIVDLGKGLPEKELQSALQSITPYSFKALVQAIDGFRQEHALSAARQAQANNPLAMAVDNGAYETLSGLIEYLNEQRKPQD